MGEGVKFPELVERALRYLADRPSATEAELCGRLFGAAGGGPWSQLLAQILRTDDRFERRADGQWLLSGRRVGSSSLANTEMVAVSVLAAGPKPWRHPLIAIATRCFRPSRPDEQTTWTTILNPGRPMRIPDYVLSRGITAEEIAQAPSFRDVAGSLSEWLGPRVIVASDAGLTAAWLQQSLREAGRPPIANPLIDLGSLAALALGDKAAAGKPDMARLAALTGLTIPEAKGLDASAALVVRVASALIARLPSAISSQADLLSALESRNASAPANGLDASRRRILLDGALARGLPHGPGVYLFLSESGVVLYVGKATSLRGRLTSYLNSDVSRVRRMPGLVEGTDEIDTIPTVTELEARLLEVRLIAADSPQYNTQVRTGVRLVWIVFEPAAAASRAKGDPRRASWARITDTRPDGLPNEYVVGPLSDDQARCLVKEAARAHEVTGRKRDSGWADRARAAWSEVAAEWGRSPVGGGLLADDLVLFALMAPWLAVREPEENPSSPEGGEDWSDGPDWSPVAEPGSISVSAGYDLRDNVDGDDWTGINQDWRAESEDRAENGVSSTDDTIAPRETPRWLRDGAIRAVILGRDGFVGGLTIDTDLKQDEVRSQLLAMLSSAAGSRTASAELGLALAEATRRSSAGQSDTVIALGPDLSDAATRLLNALACRVASKHATRLDTE